MRMHLVVAASLGFALTPSVCQARLGETMEQCVARYGQRDLMQDTTPPSNVVGDSIADFKKDDYNIIVTFLHGVVGSEMILKKDNSDFSDTEIKMFLDSESGGSSWNKLPKEYLTDKIGVEHYVRADGSAYADCWMGSGCNFAFESKVYRDAQQAKDDAAKKDPLHGF